MDSKIEMMSQMVAGMLQNIVDEQVAKNATTNLDSVLEFIKNASVGYIGVQRDEKTLLPTFYYKKIPSIDDDTQVIILDPMLATGGSLSYAIDLVKKEGAKNIICATIVSVQEGIDKVLNNHPNVSIYTCAKDLKLNEKGYIVPGLGDCGDRLFGTK